MTNFNYKKLRELRKNKGLTQIDFANLAKIGVASLIRYEKGEREPSLEIIEKLAKALEVSPFILMDIDNLSDYEKSTELIHYQSHLLNNPDQWREEENELFSNSSEHIVSYYNKLNKKGKAEATRRTRELTEIFEYIKPDED